MGGKTLRVILLLTLFLGFLFIGIGQQVVTTTTTTLITIPGTTYTTILPGGTSTITIILPEITIVEAYRSPDQVCTVVLKPIRIEREVEIPGTTFIFPGTTYQTVMSETMIKYSETVEKGGTETTTTALTFYTFNIVKTIEIPAGRTTLSTVFSYPMVLPFYGEIVERCNKIVVVREITLMVGNAPATVYIAYPGYSFAFEGTKFTIEEDGMVSIPATTIIETRTGGTGKTTYTQRATTILTTVEVPSGITVITSPGKIVTSTITYVITLEETTKTTPTTVTQYTSPTVTETTPKTETRTQTTQTPMAFGGISPELIIIIIVVAIIAIVVAVFLARRR